MRYSAYIADQSFKTDAQGNNLFFLQGPFSRPYIIPNIEEKQRLHKRLTWFYRVILTALILGMTAFGGFISQPTLFFSVLVGVVALGYVVLRLVFRHDLRVLKRSDAPFGLRRFYAGMAAQHSLTKLVLGFVGSLLFVACGLFLLYVRAAPAAIAVACILFFGLCAVAWGYAIRLKMRTKNTEPVSGANAG